MDKELVEKVSRKICTDIHPIKSNWRRYTCFAESAITTLKANGCVSIDELIREAEKEFNEKRHKRKPDHCFSAYHWLKDKKNVLLTNDTD